MSSLLTDPNYSSLSLGYKMPDNSNVPSVDQPAQSPGLFSAEGATKLAGAFAGVAALGSGIVGIFQALNAGKQAELEAAAARDRAAFDVQYAQILSDDTARRALLMEEHIRARTAQYVGASKASAAAQGIRSDTGTASEVVLQARLLAEHEILEVRNNAARQVFGFKTQQNAAQGAAAYAGIAADNIKTQSLLAGVSGGLLSAKRGLRDFAKAVF